MRSAPKSRRRQPQSPEYAYSEAPVATPCLEALADRGDQALADDNPGRALAGFPTRTIEAQVIDASLSTVTAAPTDALPRTMELKQTLRSVGGQLPERARNAGVVRPDLTSGDLVPLMCGIAYAANIPSIPADRIETARRYLTVLLEGLYMRRGQHLQPGRPDRHLGPEPPGPPRCRRGSADRRDCPPSQAGPG
ncbi:hypothetical protein OG883_39435 [Streptomyces sp. NBC_01142]|uniref:SbtR family transcriptional regulator n=1 Tax=Streptomyces sp. NBC_01142 TaxID=2975865 RepID=UPI002253A2A2|nr:hypothetical protein [Streptomyces sp. NBC_01142]MCX4825802.1 hypothetical protein [Streptomyces sp. NBC_01142]